MEQYLVKHDVDWLEIIDFLWFFVPSASNWYFHFTLFFYTVHVLKSFCISTRKDWTLRIILTTLFWHYVRLTFKGLEEKYQFNRNIQIWEWFLGIEFERIRFLKQIQIRSLKLFCHSDIKVHQENRAI